MKDGFLIAATATPEIKIADPAYNADKIIEYMAQAKELGVSLLVFPELSVTGYTCGDLFASRTLICAAEEALARIREASKGFGALVFVGAPLRHHGKLYNCAVAVCGGEILGVVPKKHLPNYGEFYEKRNFTAAPEGIDRISLLGEDVPFGTNLIFRALNMPEFSVAAEICEDLWVVTPPSLSHAAAGAKIIINLSASNEIIGKADYRRALVTGQSARTVGAYVYADAGSSESTTDMVFSGHSMIAENGRLLAERAPFDEGMQTAVLDVFRLADERLKTETYVSESGYAADYLTIPFEAEMHDVPTPKFPKRPFVPSDKEEFEKRAESIIGIQSAGLRRRLAHTGAKTAVIGISGGLDSTLALLVCTRAMDMLNRQRRDIIAVTMPCFGTTARTKSNAVTLAEALGVTVKTVDIRHAVEVHFSDIGHDAAVHDVTYENAQARERTQVLMDIANASGGIVVGTGDLSELALGWSTYNGDHMSMYGVNCSVPKTLVRYLVAYFAGKLSGAARESLLDIMDTPVSPELLPAENGEIAQKTEDIVGPYDLHDFFLYYTVRMGFSPKKLFRAACCAFEGEFDAATVLKWQKQFYRRFFSQQFKRSCIPDGPKVGSVSLSPRGDWRMPSDASAAAWLREAEDIKL